MTIVWDDAGDGTVFDHNDDPIGTLDPDEPLTFPSDVQDVINDTYRESEDNDYREELLLRKIDADIARTSKSGSVPS